jgi:ribosomal protein L40E
MYHMPFMDDLSKFAKTIGDGASNVAKKSIDVVEVGKLNLSIQGEESKIKELKEEIGGLILSKFERGEMVDPEVFDACGQILAIKNNIMEIQKKILALKHVPVCLNCGSAVTPNSVFCTKCGARLQPQPANSTNQQVETMQQPTKICPNCNTQLPVDTLYCTTCGKAL